MIFVGCIVYRFLADGYGDLSEFKVEIEVFKLSEFVSA